MEARGPAASCTRKTAFTRNRAETAFAIGDVARGGPGSGTPLLELDNGPQRRREISVRYGERGRLYRRHPEIDRQRACSPGASNGGSDFAIVSTSCPRRWRADRGSHASGETPLRPAKQLLCSDGQFQLDRIVRRVRQILLRPEVSLGRLDRRMAEQ
jgi:hypothetical protein